jgi:hypothetical protein
MKTTIIVGSLLLMIFAGCTHQQPSRIVTLAEQAGAGPLDGVSTVEIRFWLSSHPQVATRVDALCAPLRTHATAAWPQTTEGRLCIAARAVAGRIEAEQQLRRHPDHTGFLPGRK